MGFLRFPPSKIQRENQSGKYLSPPAEKIPLVLALPQTNIDSARSHPISAAFPVCNAGIPQNAAGKRHYNFVDLWRPGYPSSEGSGKTYIGEVPIVEEFPILFPDTWPMGPRVR